MYRDQYGNRKTCSKLNNAGVTLVEVLVTIAILGVVGGLIIGFLQAGTKSYQSTDEEADIQYDAQVLLNQIGDYVIDANAGFRKKDDTVYIYSHNGSALETEELSWNPQEQTLYYTKKQTVKNTETILVEKTLLAKDVSRFAMDLSQVENKKIQAELALQKEKKDYTATATWNLRNVDLVSGNVEDNEEYFSDYVTVTSVVVSSSRTLIRPGEEQIFSSKVIGTGASQKVVWYIDGTVTSEDTYVDEGGTLHVGKDEQASEFKVAAQSVHDPRISGSLGVQINDAAIRIAPQDVWLGAKTNDPDSYGKYSVDLTAEIAGKNEDGLSDLVWTSSRQNYTTSLNEQTDNRKKTLTLLNSQSNGTVWVQAAADDAAGNHVTSNQANLHVVKVTVSYSGVASRSQSLSPWAYGTNDAYAWVYIYGLEDVPQGELKVAHSFEEIEKNSQNCQFYLYDSKATLSYINTSSSYFSKLSSGAWRCYIRFLPKYPDWNKIFPSTASEYTYIGVYKAGELNPKVDEAGRNWNYGFAVSKVKLSK